MKSTLRKPLGAGLLVLLAAGGLAGCHGQGHRPDPAPRATVYLDYPADYYYYPGVQVYFNIHSGYYWYRDRGRWHRTYRLPHHFVLRHHDRARIHIDRGEPWRHHREHVERYRPALTPRGYERPRMREYDRQEREHNQRLYRDNRDRHESPQRREQRQETRQVPRPESHQDRRQAPRAEVRQERRQDRREDIRQSPDAEVRREHRQDHRREPTPELRQEKREVTRQEHRQDREDRREEYRRRY